MSCLPSGEKYASAFSPPEVNCLTLAKCRSRLVALLDGWSDVGTADQRIGAFVASFPADREHRWSRDLAAEVALDLALRVHDRVAAQVEHRVAGLVQDDVAERIADKRTPHV